MSKLKRLNGILAWDVLDDFYGYEVKGFNINYENFPRSFCRCGETTTTFRDKCDKCGNFNFITKKNDAPSINKTIRTYYNYGESADEKVEALETSKMIVGKNVNGIRLLQTFLVVVEDRKANGLNFKLDFQSDNSIYEEIGADINEYTISSLSPRIKNFCEEYPNFERDFMSKASFLVNEYKNLLEMIPDDSFIRENIEMDGIGDIEKLFFCGYVKNNFKEFLECNLCKRYPFVLKGFVIDLLFNTFARWRCQRVELSRSTTDFTKIIDKKYANGDDMFRDLFPIDEKYYSIMDLTAKELLSCRMAYYRESSFYRGRKVYFNDFIKLLEEESTGMEEILLNYVRNGLMNWLDAYLTIIHIKNASKYSDLEKYAFRGSESLFCDNDSYFGGEYNKHTYAYSHLENYDDFFKNEYLEFFPIYLKENISSLKSNYFLHFLEKIQIMVNYKIPIKEENFKIRNFNYYMNHALLSEKYRLPQGKVDLFLDMFEVNPLEAMTMVSNRRKLTKKEQDAFLEIMLKNS